MRDATADWQAALNVMSEAFLAGDNPRGEALLSFALDEGAPWDVATSTVAQALSTRRGAPDLPRAAIPVPI